MSCNGVLICPAKLPLLHSPPPQKKNWLCPPLLKSFSPLFEGLLLHVVVRLLGPKVRSRLRFDRKPLGRARVLGEGMIAVGLVGLVL